MSFGGIEQRLRGLWYQQQLDVALFPLLPLSWLFRLVVWLRHGLYRSSLLRSYRLPVPVIVIGNLTVGGSGKTPLVLWLVERLCERGWRPGIVSRGHGGTAEGVQAVALDSASSLVGDEPLLLARRSRVPVFVARDRVAAGQGLLSENPGCNIIISDDGLQHYRMQRSVEITVFDARGAGNARLLPAGPLREPLHRLSAATALVWNASPQARALIKVPAQMAKATLALPQFMMRVVGKRFFLLSDAQVRCTADDLRGKRLYAMAGIGDPSRFFAQVSALGLEFDAHPFADHHVYSAADLAFADDGVLLMTEKDAVKCVALTAREAWVLPVDAQVDAAPDGQLLLDTILEIIDGRTLA